MRDAIVHGPAGERRRFQDAEAYVGPAGDLQVTPRRGGWQGAIYAPGAWVRVEMASPSGDDDDGA